jgi:cytochrome c55X
MRVGLAAGVTLMGVGLAGAAMAGPSPDRQDQLRAMVSQDCGSCHGMTRKGGLGSPLLPELLSQYSEEGVVETILEGRPGTPMPPWKSMLSRDDAVWIAAYLMRGEK